MNVDINCKIKKKTRITVTFNGALLLKEHIFKKWICAKMNYCTSHQKYIILLAASWSRMCKGLFTHTFMISFTSCIFQILSPNYHLFYSSPSVSIPLRPFLCNLNFWHILLWIILQRFFMPHCIKGWLKSVLKLMHGYIFYYIYFVYYYTII